MTFSIPSSSKPYKMSFTTGGLYYREAVKLTELYAELGSWPAVSQAVRSENLLQARTQSSLNRTAIELLQRLQTLTTAELEVLRAGSRSEQQHILWLAVCKQYRFVREFALEVLREKYLRIDYVLAYPDYDAFFYNKAEWSPELESTTRATREKTRQVLFRILAEAQLISSQKEILPQVLSAAVVRAVVADDPIFLFCFPLSDFDIQRYKAS